MQANSSLGVALYGFGCVANQRISKDPHFLGILHVWRRNANTKLMFCSESSIKHKCRFYSPPTDQMQLAKDADIPIVIEVMGGTDGLAYDVMSHSITLGKIIITANKSLLASRMKELEILLDNARLLYEAAVCGGMPLIHTLKRFHLSVNDSISRIHGILNGSTNYFLTTMEKDSTMKSSELISKMQSMGFLEADPSLDLQGIDAQHKLLILIRLTFKCFPNSDMLIEGVNKIEQADFHFARSRDCKLRLVAGAYCINDQIEASVLPSFVPNSSTMANVEGSLNYIAVQSLYMGGLQIIAPGAGSLPTAQSVVSDLKCAIDGSAHCMQWNSSICENRHMTRVWSARTEIRRCFVLRYCWNSDDAEVIKAVVSCNMDEKSRFGQFEYVTCFTDLTYEMVTDLRNKCKGGIVIYQEIS